MASSTDMSSGWTRSTSSGRRCRPWLNAPPTPYTRERFDDTYNWTVGWNMTVPGATYENIVDNRAWLS